MNPYKIILLFTTFLALNLNAQEESFKKNSFYINYGTVIFVNQYSLNYERTVYQSSDHVLRTKVKFNYGASNNNYDLEEDEEIISSYFSLSAVQLLRFNQLDFEFNIGAAKTTLFTSSDPTEFNKVKLYGCTGIRYEKKHFLFRAGISNFELLYLGLGFNI